MMDPTEADVVFCQMKTEFAKNLLSCPFCGNKAVIYASLTPVDERLFRAECRVCLSSSGIYKSVKQVEQAWNRRVGDTDVSG